jgi:hypothetical protein
MANMTMVAVEKHPYQTEEESLLTEVCEKCGETVAVGSWPFCPHPGGVSLVTEKSYPFTTKNFTGQPVEVTSRAHEKALMAQHGLVKRDDVAWVDKEYVGYNHRTGKQEYKEGRGMGNPGCWF